MLVGGVVGRGRRRHHVLPRSCHVLVGPFHLCVRRRDKNKHARLIRIDGSHTFRLMLSARPNFSATFENTMHNPRPDVVLTSDCKVSTISRCLLVAAILRVNATWAWANFATDAPPSGPSARESFSTQRVRHSRRNTLVWCTHNHHNTSEVRIW